MWGIESLGLSPTQLDIVCTQTAGASGCTVAGRCVTTAIAFSNVVHPAIFIARRMLLSYFQLLPLYTGHIHRFRTAWAEAWKHVLCIDECAYLEEGVETSRYPHALQYQMGVCIRPPHCPYRYTGAVQMVLQVHGSMVWS